jgi:hypothetical protein
MSRTPQRNHAHARADQPTSRRHPERTHTHIERAGANLDETDPAHRGNRHAEARVRPVGRGGTGTVYLAIDTRFDRKLALNVMIPRYAANPAA